MTVRGIDAAKVPVVIVKRSAKMPTQMLVVLPACAFELMMHSFQQWLGSCPPDARQAKIRGMLREYPGMRKRVAEYVAKSEARGRFRKKEPLDAA